MKAFLDALEIKFNLFQDNVLMESLLKICLAVLNIQLLLLLKISFIQLEATNMVSWVLEIGALGVPG